MNVLELLKDVFLVFVGGFITFLGTLGVNRVQARKPSLVWRLLPPVTFPSQEITSFNLSVENNGTIDAENVRVLVGYPNEASIESFEIQVSEKAMKYKIQNEVEGNEITITFPSFYKGLDCILSFLAKHLDPKDIVVSIVGDNVIGQEKVLDLSDISRQIKRYWLVYNFMAGIVILSTVGFVIFLVFFGLVRANYTHCVDITDLYVETGHPELAIDKYQEMMRQWWWPQFAADERLYYRLASAYASTNDVESSIYYLRKAAIKDPKIIELVITDKSFDSIRHTPEFTAMMQEVK